MLADLERSKGEIAGHQGELDALNAIVAELQSLQVATTNPYTTLTPDHLESKWEELKTFITSQREQRLKTELETQKQREEIRIAFALKANEVGAWLEGQSEKLANMAVNVSGSLEVRAQLRSCTFEFSKVPLSTINSFFSLADNHAFFFFSFLV